MIPESWFPHRRADGETVGWIEPVGEGFRPRDLLGRPLAEPGEWLEVEDLLEAQGLGWLAEPQLLEVEGEAPHRVRITEITRAHVRLVDDENGAAQAVGAGSPQRRRWTLPLPLEERLAPLRR